MVDLVFVITAVLYISRGKPLYFTAVFYFFSSFFQTLISELLNGFHSYSHIISGLDVV